MIAKNKSRYDLERKRSALFLAGLLAAGSFTLAAFSYTSEIPSEFERQTAGTDMYQLVYQIEKEPEQESIIEQPVHVHQNQESNSNENLGNPNAISENLNSTDNTSDMVTPGLDIPNVGIIDDGTIIIEEDSIDPFPITEAAFVGGIPAMHDHLSKNLNYPQEELGIGKGGKVYVSFVVEKDGSVSNVEIARSASRNLDREAMRLVRMFPRWIPGENAYGKCRTRVVLPINFQPE